jgi:hypothetical protein
LSTAATALRGGDGNARSRWLGRLKRTVLQYLLIVRRLRTRLAVVSLSQKTPSMLRQTFYCCELNLFTPAILLISPLLVRASAARA